MSLSRSLSFRVQFLSKPCSSSLSQGSYLKLNVPLEPVPVVRYIPHIPHLAYSRYTRSTKLNTLSEESIPRYESLTQLLRTWREQHKLLSPDITLSCLLRVTSLIRISKNYDTLSTPLFKQLLQSSIDNITYLNPEQLVKLLWLMAKIKWADYNTITKIGDSLQSRLPQLTDKAIGLIPWSLVTLNVFNQHKSLINRVIGETCRRLKRDMFNFDDRALSNVCWSLYRANSWPKDFIPYVIKFLKVRGKGMSPHTLSQLLYSLSKVHILKTDECQWLFELVTHHVPQFKSTDTQSLGQILWSIGNQKQYNQQLFNALETVIVSGELINKYSSQLIATILWVCARARYYSHDLLKHLSEQVPTFIGKMTIQDLSMTSYSLGYLNYPCPDLLKLIAEHVMVLYANYHVANYYQAFSNLAWACIINEVYSKDVFEICMSQEVIEHFKTTIASQKPIYTHQLLQLDLASRCEHPGKGLPLLSPHDRLQFLVDSATIGINNQSTFEKTVANVLVEEYGHLGMETFSLTGYRLDFELLLDHDNDPISISRSSMYEAFNIDGIKQIYAKMSETEEAFDYRKLNLSNLQKDNDSGFLLSCDWSTSMKNVKRRIAIEADGPFHFAVNCRHPLGRTALKTRQLKAFGWEVVSVPFFEWKAFGFNEKEKMINYLKNKLSNTN